MSLKPVHRPLREFFTTKAFLALTILGNLFLLAIVSCVYLLERNIHSSINTFFDALWWGVTTITTVGYGDIVPSHPIARWLGLILMYSGTVLFIAFTSLFASYWFRSEIVEEVQPLERDIRKELRETRGIEEALNRIEKRLQALEERDR